MRCPDIVWLGSQVQDTIAVPVVTTSRDQILVLAIPHRCLIAVITDILPNIDITIDQSESRCCKIEITILVVAR